jgi:hypothetical protein
VLPFIIIKRIYGAFYNYLPPSKKNIFLVAGLRYEKSNVSIAVVNPRIGFNF